LKNGVRTGFGLYEPQRLEEVEIIQTGIWLALPGRTRWCRPWRSKRS